MSPSLDDLPIRPLGGLLPLSWLVKLLPGMAGVFEREPNLAAFSYEIIRAPHPTAQDPMGVRAWPRAKVEPIDPGLPCFGEAERWVASLPYRELRALEDARLARPEPGASAEEALLRQLLTPEEFALWEGLALAPEAPAPASRGPKAL